MKKFEFDHKVASVEVRLQARLENLESSGLTHMQALQTLKAEIGDELTTFKKSHLNTNEYTGLIHAERKVELAILSLKWIEKHNYPPRIHKRQYDFDQVMKAASRLPNRTKQIAFLQLTLQEYIEFVGDYPSQFGTTFGDKIEFQIRNIKMEEALETQFSAPFQKLVWMRKVSELGFLITELIDKGYLEDPSGTAQSPKAIAEFLLLHFELKAGTTIQTLTKELNRNSQTLSDSSRDKLSLPNVIELETMMDKKSKKKQ